MKVQINNETILELNKTQENVIKYDVLEEIYESDMQRRLNWCIHHPANRFVERHAKYGREFLKSQGLKSCPSDPIELAAKVFEYSTVDMTDIEKESHIVKVDGKDCFVIDSTTKKLLKMDVSKDKCCVEYCKERMQWVLMHKYERCMERLRREWEPKLMALGMKELPLDDDEFAELVFSQPNYKNRSQREAESLEVENGRL